jgi:hypothetical protein
LHAKTYGVKWEMRAYEAGDLELEVEVTDGPLNDGDYRLTIRPTITDLVGNALTNSSNYTQIFNVDAISDQFVFEGRDNETKETATTLTLITDPDDTGLLRTEKDGRGSLDSTTDVDYYKFTALAGDRAAIHVTPLGTSYPTASILRPDGSYLAGNALSGPADGAFISGVELVEDGEYFVRVDRSHTGGSFLDDYTVRIDLSRGVPMESDAGYDNDQIHRADSITFTTVGNTSSALIAGTIMSPENTNFDEDVFKLGLLNAGTTVTLETKLPQWSSLSPNAQVIDENGNLVTDMDGELAACPGT